MFRYQIIVEYDGTNHSGWQSQKNAKSIQKEIEKIFSKILKMEVNISGSGRTDAGVHATGQSANFLLDKKIENKKIFLNSINFFLKKYSISIIDIKKQKLNFHSRYDAKERMYNYRIINRYGALALNTNRAWLIKSEIDIYLLKKGAKILEGTHDFSTFRAASCSAKSPIKKMKHVK